jgi:hypothetical protein
MFLLTASEVVLGTAIIMGLSAIVTILLRVCSRPRLPRNGPNASNIPDEFGRGGLRVSLTSLQQRVMSKLRDRPPRYETRHNFEYQRREQNRRISVLNPGAALPVANIPPPAYEANSENSSVSEGGNEGLWEGWWLCRGMKDFVGMMGVWGQQRILRSWESSWQ